MTQGLHCCYVSGYRIIYEVQQQDAEHLPSEAKVLQHVNIEQLIQAVSTDTGIPPGRVRRILLRAEQLKSLMEQGSVASAAPAAPTNTRETNDPLPWYPVGANGRLRPPQSPPQSPLQEL